MTINPKAFKLTVTPGTVEEHNGRFLQRVPVRIEILWTGDRLSITGTTLTSCGPIWLVDGPDPDMVLALGWTREMVARLDAIWREWHLNDMQAGSPAQMAHLAKVDDRKIHRADWYTWACNELKRAGLQPDPDYMRGGRPYAYGSAWLGVLVPDDVIDWLKALPA